MELSVKPNNNRDETYQVRLGGMIGLLVGWVWGWVGGVLVGFTERERAPALHGGLLLFLGF